MCLKVSFEPPGGLALLVILTVSSNIYFIKKLKKLKNINIVDYVV